MIIYVEPMSYPDDEIPDPPQGEVEMAVEGLLRRPMPGSAEGRLDALQKRVKYLSDALRTVLDRADTDDIAFPEVERLKKELAEARRQLAEWRQQHEGRN